MQVYVLIITSLDHGILQAEGTYNDMFALRSILCEYYHPDNFQLVAKTW